MGVWWSSLPPGVHCVSLLGRQTLICPPAADTIAANRRTADAAIFVLHGSGQSAVDMLYTEMHEAATCRNGIVVYPEMRQPRADSWGYAADLKYFTAIVEYLEQHLRLDPAAPRFVCGHSAGGTMSLFLQNQGASLFQKVASVEGAVQAHPDLHGWDPSSPGLPALLVWNHADPVLAEYAPYGGEPAYYAQSIRMLWGLKPTDPLPAYKVVEQLPTSATITNAEVRLYSATAGNRLDVIESSAGNMSTSKLDIESRSELRVVSFTSQPGRHDWAARSWCTFNATHLIVDFFLGPAHDQCGPKSS